MLDKLDLQLFGEAEDEVVDLVQDMLGDYDRMGETFALEVAKLAQLKRIADALEDMQQSLDCLSELTSCINERGQFCITGEISNSEGY